MKFCAKKTLSAIVASFLFYAGSIVAESPMAHWKMDAIQAGMVAGENGRFPARVHGNVSPAPGAIDQSLRFDGNSYLLVTAGEQLSFPNATFSISLWINVYEISTDNQMLIGKHDYANNMREWGLVLASDGKLRLYMRTPGDHWTFIQSRTAPRFGEWYHVAVTVENGYSRLYVNGELESQNQLASAMIPTTAPLGIAAVVSRGNPVQRLHGALDDVRLYDYALDSAKVKLLASRDGDLTPLQAHPIPKRAEAPAVDMSDRVALWSGERFPNAAGIPVVENASFHVIKPYEFWNDGYRWLHGVAVAWHGDRLYATFGHNSGGENKVGEEARGRYSEDGGRTWSEVFTIEKGHVDPALAGKSFEQLRAMDNRGVSPGDSFGVSHGVLLSHNGELWSFNGAFAHTIHFNHTTRVFRLNEDGYSWSYQGSVLNDFWPLQAPRKMDDGNWIMAGVHTPPGGREAAVAISRGDDLMQWELVVIPKVDPGMWGESGVFIDGRYVSSIARSSPGLASALVATSSDFGRTWTPSEPSNLPMASTKPAVGTLSTGQHYLISTTTADGGNRRAPLTIALTEPGERTFSRVLVIRHAVFPDGPGESHPGANLSYPDAIEHDGKLYVVYSNSGDASIRVGEGRERANNNSAELAIIPLASLQ